MNQLMQFDFRGHTVRTVQINGEPWFVGRDVAEILGYTNPQKAVRDHCKRPRPVGSVGVNETFTLDPQTIIIPESDLYRLVMRSRLPEAEEFEEWVTGTVLPSIRKTGTYIAPGAAPSQAQLALVMAQALVEQERRLAAVEERVRGIEARQQEAEQHLQAMPGPTGPVAEVSTRALLNRLVRAYSIETGIPHNSLWRQLYREFRDRYHVDLIARSTKNKKPIDVAEEIGHVQTLYDLACHLFKRAAS